MIETVEEAESWVSRQGCSKVRADLFVGEVDDALKGCGSSWSNEDKVKDYIDSLRRAPYVGMGI